MLFGSLLLCLVSTWTGAGTVERASRPSPIYTKTKTESYQLIVIVFFHCCAAVDKSVFLTVLPNNEPKSSRMCFLNPPDLQDYASYFQHNYLTCF